MGLKINYLLLRRIIISFQSACIKKYTPRFNRVVTMMMTSYHQPLLGEMDSCTLLLNCGGKLTLQRLQRDSAALELQLVVISLPIALSYT